jgi:hypothetical protein
MVAVDSGRILMLENLLKFRRRIGECRCSCDVIVHARSNDERKGSSNLQRFDDTVNRGVPTSIHPICCVSFAAGLGTVVIAPNQFATTYPQT